MLKIYTFSRHQFKKKIEKYKIHISEKKIRTKIERVFI